MNREIMMANAQLSALEYQQSLFTRLLEQLREKIKEIINERLQRLRAARTVDESIGRNANRNRSAQENHSRLTEQNIEERLSALRSARASGGIDQREQPNTVRVSKREEEIFSRAIELGTAEQATGISETVGELLANARANIYSATAAIDSATAKEQNSRASRADREAERKRLNNPQPGQRDKESRPARKINLIVDISKNLKAQQSKGYEHALIKNNINIMVKTMNYLIQHNLTTPDDFQRYYSEVSIKLEHLEKNKKKITTEMLELSEKIEFTKNYKKNKAIYLKFLSSGKEQQFYQNHQEEIVQYKAALIYFERKQLHPDKVNLHQLFQEYKDLSKEKNEMISLHKITKEQKYELDIIKQNLEYSLDFKVGKEEEVQKKQEKRNCKNTDRK